MSLTCAVFVTTPYSFPGVLRYECQLETAQSISPTHTCARDFLFSPALGVCVWKNYKQQVSFYLYREGQVKRGPDQICSLLLYYISNHVSEAIRELFIFPTAVLDKTETILMSNSLQLQLLMGDSQNFPVLSCQRTIFSSL